MRLNDFKKEFAGWENAKYVLPGGDLTDETFFSAFASDEVREKQSELVEVIRYYSKETDEFIILANGVWVNPLSKSKVCPLPFSHKELPFYTILFEPFSSTFPYGKALPDKMLGEQDSINALLNMGLDQHFVSIHPLLVTGDEDVLDDVDLTPNSINYVGADTQNILEIKRTPPSNSYYQMLQYLAGSIEQSSVDSVQQGSASEAKTATAVREAAGAASRSFLLFLSFVFHGYKRKAKLRTANILQFLTTPSILKKVMGDDGEERFDEAFQNFKVSNVSLSNGKQGERVIELVDQKTLESKYQNREKERTELEAQNIERFYITPEYIREFSFDVEAIEGSTVKETEDVEKALEIEFQTMINQLYPDLVNREGLFDELVKKFKKDPRLIKNMMSQPMMNPMMGGQGGTPMSQQITQQATGGRQMQKPSLNQLQQ